MQGQAKVRKLLLVDDEPQILNSLTRELNSEGYTLFTAKDGPSGLDIIWAQEIGVVLSDQQMPGMDGVTFLEQVKSISPNTTRLMLTAHDSFEYAQRAINRSSVFAYLTKPWDRNELKVFLDMAFEHYEMIMELQRLRSLSEKQNEELDKFYRNLKTSFANVPFDEGN